LERTGRVHSETSDLILVFGEGEGLRVAHRAVGVKVPCRLPDLRETESQNKRRLVSRTLTWRSTEPVTAMGRLEEVIATQLTRFEWPTRREST
jgi:hypothetical protein